MIDKLINLLSLQQLDNELAVLEHKSKDTPRRIEGIRLVFENKKTELDNTQKDLVESKKRYKLLEVDLRECEEKIAQFSTQLYSAKNNDQYKAFLKEIDGQKKVKLGIEDKMIEVLENIETAEKQLKHSETELNEIDKETKAKIAVLKTEEQTIHNAITERLEKRKEICEVLGRDTLAIYERIKKNKGGVAVVVVDGERCGGCLNPLPAQKVLEIKKNDRIHFCEYCGRIAVAPGITDNNQ